MPLKCISLRIFPRKRKLQKGQVPMGIIHASPKGKHSFSGMLKCISAQVQPCRDYPLNLFCVNEHSGFDEFHTDLRQLFRAMNCRKDKQKLTELMGDKLYSHLNEDTWDAIAVMTDNAALLQNKEAFRNTYGNQEGFDMCQALDELMADKMNEGILIGKHEGILIGKHEGILIGKREGKHEGILLEKQNSEAKIRTIISNMLAGGISCENICRFLECDPSLVEQVRKSIQ